VRRALEDITLDLLAVSKDIARLLVPLRDMVDREQQAFERGDRISWIRLSNAFHVELARLLDNQVLTELLTGLCARTTLIIALGDRTAGSTCSYVEHREILDHLARGDATSARAAMDHHLQDCELRMEEPGTGTPDPWSAFSVKR
jgi:DNA-binding GntR family transcriptional regulator